MDEALRFSREISIFRTYSNSWVL